MTILYISYVLRQNMRPHWLASDIASIRNMWDSIFQRKTETDEKRLPPRKPTTAAALSIRYVRMHLSQHDNEEDEDRERKTEKER